MRTIFRFIVRLVMLLAGLVFLASLLVAAMLVLAVWLLQALWAKLTGQPVRPWTFSMNRQAMWSRFYSGQTQGPPPKRDDPNVIDVEIKEVKEVKEVRPPRDN